MNLNFEIHHHFAWEETRGGDTVLAHRKSATPAGASLLRLIPGSMTTSID